MAVPPDTAGQVTGNTLTPGPKPAPRFIDTQLAYAYQDNIALAEMAGMGTASLFNDYAVFRYDSAAGDYNRLYDDKGDTITPASSRNPTAGNIIKWFQEYSDVITPYAFADFLWCKYYGRIPNNYLVTLRRYPIPMVDNLKTNDTTKIPPIAQAVTWLGEETGNKLSEIFKFTCGLTWKEIEAAVQNVNGNEKGMEAAFGGIIGANAVAGAIGLLNPAEFSGQAHSETEYAKEQYGSDGPYANKVYGPVNAINKTLARDMGLRFEQEIVLNFHYELKSFSSINPKAAMLDILANMLTLTYNNAKFWGGAIRYFPQHPNVPFLGSQADFYSGKLGPYLSSLGTDFSHLGTDLTTALSGLFTGGNFMEALKKVGSMAGTFTMGKIAAKDRPQILAIRSLLTGAPVGEWHLVIGNPMNPIAMIGNLVCDNMEVEFSDELGADDFPTEVKFTIKLRHGRPRDKGDIESMFNNGNGRLYYGINDDAVFASANNSMVDESAAKGAVTNNTYLGSKQFTTLAKERAAKMSPDQTKANADAASSLKNTGKSMWGSKFKIFELQIAQKWAGGGMNSEKKTA